jgi:parallel beta-helix repeat protein
MKRVIVALTALCAVSCTKSRQPVTPETSPPKDSSAITMTAESFPFAFEPDEAVTGYVLQLEYNSAITDYAAIIKDKLTEIADHGGGTLVVPYGEYPIKSEMVFARHTGPAFHISIKGERGPNGQFPLFYDKDPGALPHQFLSFQSNWSNPQLSFSVSNLRIEGNNVPFSASHPFYGPLAVPQTCISGRNVHSGTVKNVIISNVYGNGIEFVNGGTSGKNTRVESVVIKSCKILNSWSDNLQDNSGDGIMLWGCNNPVVQNCIISSNPNTVNYYPRCGIVLEHGSEKATIRNNYIEGYKKNIHIECDYGGHLIENNYLMKNGRWGIVFVESCAQDPAQANDYSPCKVRNNIFQYDQTYLQYGADHRAFISMEKSFVLDGMEITGNKFVFDEKGSNNDRANYINTHEPYNVYIQTHGQDLITISGNIYN